VLGTHVAARIALDAEFCEQRLLGPEEAHRQQRELRGALLLRPRHLDGDELPLVAALPSDLHGLERRELPVGIAHEFLDGRQVRARVGADFAAASSWP